MSVIKSRAIRWDNLKGKSALITGGSHGIGLATALALASEGCDISICGRDQSRLESAKLEITKYDVKCVITQADVLETGACEKVVGRINDKLGPIDILINNVGGGGRWGDPLAEDTDKSVWQEVWQKNTATAVNFTMACLPYMRHQKWGRIITVASIYGRENGGRPWFQIAKSAEISLMKSLSSMYPYAREGITFNSVAPGAIQIPDTGWSKMQKEQPEEYKKFCDTLPMGRLGTPEEVANLICFLCSDKASFINGACIAIDGGESKSF